MARNFMICCVLYPSVIVVQVVATASKNRLVLVGQLYNADCKYEGDRLKPYLPEKMTVVVLKMLVFECAWAPSLLYARIVSTLDSMQEPSEKPLKCIFVCDVYLPNCICVHLYSM